MSDTRSGAWRAMGWTSSPQFDTDNSGYSTVNGSTIGKARMRTYDSKVPVLYYDGDEMRIRYEKQEFITLEWP